MKKISPKIFILSLVAVSLTFAVGGYTLGHLQREAALNSALKNDDLAKVRDLYYSIEENYYKKVPKNTLIEGALKGMTEALGDPYTTYLDQESSAQLNQQLSDSFEGIGARLSLVDGYPQVAEAPIKDTPAEKAGIEINDMIVKVDGTDTKGMALDKVVSKIRGKKGSEVKLQIKRGKETFDLKVKRDDIPNETVYSEIDKKDPQVGAIQITTFGEGTAGELKKVITQLRKDGAKEFLIDLRQNPGGLLDQVEIMASMFLKDGQTIVEFANAKGTISKSKAGSQYDGGFKVTEPTVVLVDKGSASASEIFAAALKESAKAPVVGSNTFGKGTVQKVAQLDQTSGVKMTVEKWLTPNGDWINDKGLTPSVTVDYPEYAYLTPLPRNVVLKKGGDSDEVKRLNEFLAALGYDTEGSVFSDQTEKAIKEVQASAGLKESGQVEEETVIAIEQLVAKKIRSEDPIYQSGLKELIKLRK